MDIFLTNNLINKKASDLMTKKPTVADQNLLVGEALNIMNNKKITSLFICINKKHNRKVMAGKIKFFI